MTFGEIWVQQRSRTLRLRWLDLIILVSALCYAPGVKRHIIAPTLVPYAAPEVPRSEICHLMIGKTVRHYRILEKLGQGGMAVVYKAEDTKLRRTVALKFLRPGITTDPSASARLTQEAQERDSLIPYIHVYADLGSLRNDPRFRVLFERLKLPAEQPMLAPSFVAGSRQDKPR